MKHILATMSLVFSATLFLGITNPLWAQDADRWGPCPASAAVVNPVCVSPLQEVISLRGSWDFVTDPSLMGRHRMGKGPGWNEPDWNGVREIQVPGCWSAQGVGEPGMSHHWGLPFDCIPRPLNHVYMGTARYRKTVDIPADWTGKRVWLKVGGVRTEAWFWVNKKRVAHLNTYCGSYKYDITDLVTPGEKAEIVATVRNDTPSRKGVMAAFHRFGGFYRDIELEATPVTRIDDVWVRGDLDKKTAIVHASIRSATEKPARDLTVLVDVKTADGTVAATHEQPVTLDAEGNAELTCTMPLDPFLPWSPETPSLYLADVRLCESGKPIHGWTERFGVRKLEVRGDRFYLNNKPFFVRGFGDDYVYPLTLISPIDRDEHRKHLAAARRAGFNYVRHHTHCENPEFFEAADELGILIQPELPYYHDIAPEGASYDPMRDIKELYRHYRRYVSFASYSCGNEGHLGSPIDVEIYQWAKKTDPDRIFQHQDGGCNMKENSDYYTPNGYGFASSIMPWGPGTFDMLDKPFVAHEYLNLGIKMDPRIATKFSGAIPSPRSLEDYEASLQAAGLDRHWGDACLDAAHALQGHYQKQGLEHARLDPACDGYSYWTIIDVMVQQAGTYTGQGFLNAFWEEKQGGLTLDKFRQFNGPTAILVKSEYSSPVAVSGETRKVELWLSHFGEAPLTQAKLVWTLKAGETVLVTGSTTTFDAAVGEVRPVDSCTFAIPEVEKPLQVQLEVKLDGTAIENGWDLWLFPKRSKKVLSKVAVTEDLFEVLSKRYEGLVKTGTPEAKDATMVIGSWDHPDLMKANHAGKRAIMIGPAEGGPNIHLGWWWLGNQLGTAFADHPAFGDFPKTESISPLWFRLIKQGMTLPIDPSYGTYEHLAVGEGQTQYFVYITQKKNDQGADILMTQGVDLLAPTPEGEYLLDQMVAYGLSEDFEKGSSK